MSHYEKYWSENLMKILKIFRLLLIMVVFGIGAWFFFRLLPTLAPEKDIPQRAIQPLAPASSGGESQESGPILDTGLVSPVVVNLKDIPPGVYDPNNKYDRWLRGEIDLDEKEGVISEAEVEALQEAAMELPPSENIQALDSVFGPNAPTPGRAFDSIDYTECCGGGGSVPPDPEIAVGPRHVIAVVNVAFEIYNKNGASLVGPTTFSSFLAADPNCVGVFDPNVLYDEHYNRYMLGIDANGTHYCAAVSQTGDPTGSWNIYSFPTVASSRDFFDYPHAGIGRDAIYMGANIFGTLSYKQAQVWAFDKVAMYAGSPAASVTHVLNSTFFTPQPLHLHGHNQGTWPTSGPHYFFSDKNYNGETYTIHSWSDPFGSDTFTEVGTVNLETSTGVSAGYPLNVPQLGSSSTLQANDYRPQDFEYQVGYGWTVQTIACNPGGGTVNCLRWAKINPATASVVDSGVYASNGEFRFFGDLAVNACGDMALGYTKSSASMYPAIFYTGREDGDPGGSIQAETQLIAGENTYTAFDSSPHRWGDYTEMTIAPDGLTFWYLGQYSKNTGTSNGRWGTYIGSFSYRDCTISLPYDVHIPLVIGN
jgi:hypothetical protein